MSMSVSTASASPPTRTKSSASVSTTHKPKRNKSSSSLHSAGGHHSIHHHVQMPQHVRKSSHESTGVTRPRLTSSGSSSTSAKKAHFGAGLGMMTSISNAPSQPATNAVAQAGPSARATGAASSQAAHTETATEVQPHTEELDASPQDELGDLDDSRASRDQRPSDPVASTQEPERGRSRSRSMDRRAAQSTERHHANAQGRDRTLPPGPGGRGDRSDGSPKRQRAPAVSQTRQAQPPAKKMEKSENPSDAVGANQTPAAPVPTPAPALAPSTTPTPTVQVKEKHSRAKFDFADDEDDGDDDEEEERQGRKFDYERATETSAVAAPRATTSTVEKAAAAPPPLESPPSPELQATKEVPTRPPMHTKSSSNLSTHTVRPKRNKSSSSLHYAHHGPGHHNVQFAGAAKKRSGSSSGRAKPAFGFGMTTLPAENHDDRRGSDASSTKGAGSSNRPTIDRRGSSTSTLVNDRIDDRSAGGRTDSRERTEVARIEPDPKASTPVLSPSTSRSRPSKKHTATKDTQEVAGSQSSASGWESATNSPFAIAKTLPSTSYRPEAVSGLAQVMGRGDEVAGIVADGDDDESADEGAKESRKVDVAPMSPPATGRPTATEPTTQSPPRSTSQPGPSSSRQPSGSFKAPPAPATNTIAFPSSSGEPPSPPRVHARPAAANVRKGSNASLMSNASARSVALSFAGRMGPPGPMFRRSGTATAPALVDRGHVGAELIGTDTPVGSFDSRRRTSGGRNPSMPAGRQVVSHGRTDSINSVRSLRAAAETSPQTRRPAPADSRQSADGGRRSIGPRTSSEYASSGSTALAALGSIASQAGSTRPPPTPEGSGGTFRRSASGYFSSALRGLTGLQALTPPLSPSASSRGGPMAGYGATTAGSTQHPASTIAKNKSRSTPSPAHFIQPVVSKFVETPPPVPSVLLSRSPAPMNAMDSAAAAKRSQSSASLPRS
ncbi:BZ3500_MvSof-1268-A1-R1_Chr10-2g02917 [Microbotryum saponariae]|uniref:BZ3500_MvSof-1268-A1-R1_Chr10-2g02917 protein n=1 Tax=Microbotryum saponariae TaxID=289078 RepID=A0A2X0L7U2_9BASI|nr:BZ3501_MvSof-1269-A2-R1_Chr10-2g02503 [Microbotryum saponariae]SDA01739.1 BZ3500_MvSof-1268-A1-R1_Chr10-2g02917 [Microbotryum saponariae]